jgi:serine protease inhibitor
MKYLIDAVPLARRSETHFLAKSEDDKLIMRMSETGDFTLFANDQNTVVEIPRVAAKDLALWILTVGGDD